MSKYGGGGSKCTVCTKTVYPAETIQYEKKPYHVDCFRCSECNKKMENSSKASNFEDKLYCKQCFVKGGFAQKQKNVQWVKKDTSNAVASKFGGGGNPCEVCTKTVYPAETMSFEKKVFHVECFKCTDCGMKVPNASKAALFEDKVKCVKCFKDKGYRQQQTKSTGTGTKSTTYSTKFGGGGNPCEVCSKTVYPAETVSFEKKIFHSECFQCTDCNTKIANASKAALFEGAVKCVKCFKDGGYRQLQAKTAQTNHTTTGGNSAIASKFGGGGAKCMVCAKTVYSAEMLSFEKNVFHGDCFVCMNDGCSTKLALGSALGQKQDDGTVKCYCKKCWEALGLNRAVLKETTAGKEEVEAE